MAFLSFHSLILLSVAFAGSSQVFDRLRALGFSEYVAHSVSDQRFDLHDAILSEMRKNVPRSQSTFRPIRLYRGIEVLLENYDAKNGRGSVMRSEGVRWMTSLVETAQFYAGLTEKARPGLPEVLNRGVVLELEIPFLLIEPGGTSLASKVRLENMPDESVFTSRVGLGRYRPQSDSKNPSQLNHAELKSLKGNIPPLLTWFKTSEILQNQRVKLPEGVRFGCSASYRQLIRPLPSLNPLF